ncbi:MAG: hypothetical protein DMF91_01830 [Acidobacteria bacterium]|nr:MAG: hypothetical protein DMF91_01830 [Acidobacteriota bacterium]
MISLASAALALLLLQVVLVALAAAVRPSANIYLTIVIISVVTTPVAVVSDTILLGQTLRQDGRAFMALINLALGGFLFHFMTLPDRSVTLRILVELLMAPGASLSAEGLRQRYSLRTMIASRLDQLTAARFMEVSADQRITLTRKGLWFGRFVTTGRKLFGIASAN